MRAVPPALTAVAIAALLAACGRADEARTEASGAPASASPDSVVVLVEEGFAPAAAGDPAWAYERRASADFDGDGADETAVLIANARRHGGEIAWDDGQRWQAYVEEADGTRTYLYARFVQLGMVEAHVAAADSGRAPSILLVERTPHRIAVHDARYHGPGRATTTRLTEREVDPARGFVEPSPP